METSLISNKLLNPDYLFNQAIYIIQQLFGLSVSFSQEAIFTYNAILLFLAFFFIAIIAYTSVRIFEIRKKEHHHLAQEIAEYAHHQAEREKKASQNDEVSKNSRWLKTLDYLFSQHESDWKLAIIEADSMLESLLDQLGFGGQTLGDKLKSADQNKFRNLTSAWEVHTIRNRIAHEGANFELTQREAKRIITLYEQIFRDYGFI